MLLTTPTIRRALIAISLLVMQVQAQQLQINYYNDHWCGNYGGSLKYYWSWSMSDTGGGCYNYRYGNSMNIANCFAGQWCMCKLYYASNCQGDYTSMQYSGFDGNKHYEYNCRFNAHTLNSMQCFHYA